MSEDSSSGSERAVLKRREVGMTGSRKRLSPIVHLAAAVAALAFLMAIAGPATAHIEDGAYRQRRHVRKRALRQVGTPYSYGGTSSSGFDCSGFTRWTFLEHGASLPHSSLEQYRLGARDKFKRIWKRKNLRVGDLVFHKTTSAKVGHVGVYTGNGKFVSSTSSNGVRVRSIWDTSYWGPRWVGATRVPAVQSRSVRAGLRSPIKITANSSGATGP
jgi:NlpC/P60 family